MRNWSLYTLAILFLSCPLHAQTASFFEADRSGNHTACIRHPWQGKRVGYIGDSITDPECYDEVKKYWEFLHEWLRITPYVYGISGREWNDVPRQAELLEKEHGKEVDAIIVLMGTNDFNAGIPIGEWFTETEEQVFAAQGEMKKKVTRKKRIPVMDVGTYKGRINIGITRMKQLFPSKQIVLITPLHRGFAEFEERNVQPDESYGNSCGEFMETYVQAVKEAGNIWGVPVIDLSSVSGMNPMIKEQSVYFYDSETDRLHPNTEGHKRMARTLMFQLSALPLSF